MKLNFAHLLTLVFVVAKIMGAVTFSWWIVFSPLFVLAIFAFLFPSIYK